jgi:hypothetical protein
MPDWAIQIAVALIALAGTAIGAAVAYRRWRSDNVTVLAKRRLETYEHLWEQVQQIDLDLRLTKLTSNAERKRVRSLNAFLLQNGPYLVDGDSRLAQDYVNALIRLHRAVRYSLDEDAQAADESTAEIPEEVVQRVVELGSMQAQTKALRSQLIRRVRAVLGRPAGS